MTKKQDGEMSMGDILLSIRKYVSEDGEQVAPPSSDDGQSYGDEIRLGADHEIIDRSPDMRTFDGAATLERETGGVSGSANEDGRTGPFDKLTEALKSYGRSSKSQQPTGVVSGDAAAAAVYQLFMAIASDLVSHWIKQNLRGITEELVLREIERLKS